MSPLAFRLLGAILEFVKLSLDPGYDGSYRADIEREAVRIKVGRMLVKRPAEIPVVIESPPARYRRLRGITAPPKGLFR